MKLTCGLGVGVIILKYWMTFKWNRKLNRRDKRHVLCCELTKKKCSATCVELRMREWILALLFF